MAEHDQGNPSAEQHTPAWMKLVIIYLVMPLFFFAIYFLFTSFFAFFAERGALDQGAELAADRTESIPAPFVVQTSLKRCVNGRRWSSPHRVQAGYSPRARDAFFGIDPRVIDDVADVILGECAESFVLKGASIDEMLLRAEMLEPHLSDGFRKGALAAAIGGTD
jgi:hypothetical protein